MDLNKANILIHRGSEMAKVSDKFFYMIWGLVFISLGISAILTMTLKLGLGGGFSLWLLAMGAVLIVGSLPQGLAPGGRGIWMLLPGMVFVLLGSILMVTMTGLINWPVALAIIVIFLGIGVIFIGMSKEGSNG